MRSEPSEPVVVALARMARRAIELDGGLLEADERDETAQEAVGLLETVELVHHPTVEQPEIARVRGIGTSANLLMIGVADLGDRALDHVSPVRLRRCA